MKTYTKIIAIVAAGIACTALTSQASVVLTIGSNGNGIQFGGGGNGTFSFLGTFNVSGDPSLTGSFTGSPFTFSSPVAASGGLVSTVSPLGGLTISDGVKTLTATVNWVELFSNASGQSGTFNDQGVLNLSNIVYTGSDANLVSLASTGFGGAVLSFSFAPGNGQTLTALYGASQNSLITDSYSGQLSAGVPEPTTIAAGAMMLLPFGLGALRSLRKDRIS